MRNLWHTFAACVFASREDNASLAISEDGGNWTILDITFDVAVIALVVSAGHVIRQLNLSGVQLSSNGSAREGGQLGSTQDSKSGEGLCDRYFIYTISFASIFASSALYSVTIPESFDLMQAIGRDASDSGWVIGSFFLLRGAVMLVTRNVMRSTQATLRALCLLSFYGRAFSAALYAVAVVRTIWVNPWRYFLIVAARVIGGVVNGLSPVFIFMATEVAPSSEKLTVSVVAAAVTSGGLALGPVLCTLVNYAGEAETVLQRSAYPMIVVAMLHLLLGLGALRLPRSLGPALASKGTDEEADRVEQKSDPVMDGAYIWVAAVFYELLRAFIVSSVEASTALILEEEFGLTTSTIGVLIGTSYFFGMPVGIIYALSPTGSEHRSGPFVRYASIALCFSALLLLRGIGETIGIAERGQVALIMIADSFIFTLCYMMSGIVCGMAYRYADPDTVYNTRNFLVGCGILCSSVRCIAPPIARHVLASRGRNSYVFVLFLVAMLNAAIIFIVSSISTSIRERHAIAMAYRNGEAASEASFLRGSADDQTSQSLLESELLKGSTDPTGGEMTTQTSRYVFIVNERFDL
jgi:hypothetical protein